MANLMNVFGFAMFFILFFIDFWKLVSDVADQVDYGQLDALSGATALCYRQSDEGCDGGMGGQGKAVGFAIDCLEGVFHSF